MKMRKRKIKEERKGRWMNKRKEGGRKEEDRKLSCPQWGDRVDNSNFSTLRSGRSSHRTVDPVQEAWYLSREEGSSEKGLPEEVMSKLNFEDE